MPGKIGMFLTFTNRKDVEPPKPAAAMQKSAAAMQKSASTTHSMRSIMRTPRNGCSSCGH